MATLLDSLKKVLKPETYAALLEEAGDDFDWSVVPYARFSKVVGERNAARQQLAEAGANGGDGDPDKKFTQKDIDDAVAAKETELNAAHDKALGELKLRGATLELLRTAGAVDAELIYDSAKFDRSKISYDKDGKLTGADELIKEFQKNNPKLFGEGGVEEGTGKSGGKNKNDQATDTALDAIFGLNFTSTLTNKD
jgi:hypothetical protein